MYKQHKSRSVQLDEFLQWHFVLSAHCDRSTWETLTALGMLKKTFPEPPTNSLPTIAHHYSRTCPGTHFLSKLSLNMSLLCWFFYHSNSSKLLPKCWTPPCLSKSSSNVTSTVKSSYTITPNHFGKIHHLFVYASLVLYSYPQWSIDRSSIRITEDSFQGSDQVRFMFSKRTLSAVERRELAWRWGDQRGSWTVAQARGDGDLTQGGAAKPREQEA